MRIFISYPDADRDLANRVRTICDGLGHKSFLAADQAELLANPPHWFKALIKLIDSSDVFILCLNGSSIDADVQQLEWTHVAPWPSPKKIIIYEGRWDRRYEDGFPAVRAFQNFSFDDEQSLAAFSRAIPFTPPEQDRFSFMRRLVIDAGTQLMMRYGAQSIYGAPQTVVPRKNPALDIDVLIQDQIVEQIREAFPDDAIIAEERKGLLGDLRPEASFVWTVDPLDGTLNYLTGDDRFCSGVGLLSEGKPFMGALFVPSRMELFTGGVGRQAECYSLANSSVKILNTDKTVDRLSDCCTITHINSEETLVDLCFADNFPYRIHQKVRRVWMWGCGLLSLLSIAKGGHHLFFQRVTYPHDVVPALAILESAGGAWTTLPHGEPLNWNPDETKVGILAACSETIRDSFITEFEIE